LSELIDSAAWSDRLSDAKRLTDPISFVDSLYFVALMQWRLGDDAGYRASCKALLDVPVDSLDYITKSRAIRTPCLAANALGVVNLLVTRADAFVAEGSPDHRRIALTVLGAALYRAGRYERAAERLDESAAAHPSDQPHTGLNVMNFQRLFLVGDRDAVYQVLHDDRYFVLRAEVPTFLGIRFFQSAVHEILIRFALY
jgi:hypothetical protein